MKCVILAGGFGTRISEETHNKPKPMVEIDGKPILWHLMKIFSNYGINDFIICCGYKKEIIQNYVETLDESWQINAVDTGENTMTGGRLKRVEKLLNGETFCFTYGDTLNDLNITALIEFHKLNNDIATVTACQPPEKYGILKIDDSKVIEFKEKPINQGKWVNGGFFVLESNIFNYIKGDETSWEKEPMEQLIKEGKLNAFKHYGFYKPMDTISDRNYLENLCKLNQAHWKVWK